MKENAYFRFKILTSKKDDLTGSRVSDGRGGSHKIELYKMMTDRSKFAEYITSLFEYGLIVDQK